MAFSPAPFQVPTPYVQFSSLAMDYVLYPLLGIGLWR